jgi:hypothetical protein
MLSEEVFILFEEAVAYGKGKHLRASFAP